MWHEYAIRYIKHNRTSSFFLALIAFVASTFLALITSVFYNIWADRVQQQIAQNRVPDGPEPLVIAYAFVLLVVCFALISMIHNAFEVSMRSRLHQLGILQSVGATPPQLRSFLLYEAMLLCALPVLFGIIVGTGLSYAFIELIISVTATVRTHDVIFNFHWGLFIVALIVALVTVLISAWIPARRISTFSPLDAMQYGHEQPVDKMKRFRIFSALFGVEGELARKSLYARRRSLRTATVSLALSFLAFVSFLNLETISGISTQYTYFDRYRDTWDFLVSFESAPADQQAVLSQLRAVPDVDSVVAYQRATAYTVISEASFSQELHDLGGLKRLSSSIPEVSEGQYRVQVPLLILDDESFAAYRKDVSATGDAILINTIWDNVNSNRMNRAYIPYLAFEPDLTLELTAENNSETVSVTITDAITQAPNLKESFSQYTLILVISESFYQPIATLFPSEGVNFNILTRSDDASEHNQQQLEAMLADRSDATLAGRVQEETSEAAMRNAVKFVIGALAVMLASIGLANVFSNTLGQIHQRKREFARYLSVGISPAGLRKILMMEAIIITLRPILLSLFINVPVVLLALNTASIALSDYAQHMPLLATVLFMFFIALFVGIAYLLGAKSIYDTAIITTLKDETLI